MSSDSILGTQSGISRRQQKDLTSKSDDSRSPAVEIEGLRKVYGQIIAVDDISLVTYRGEAFGFLGPNGAGKSTVVKILTGLVAPTKGTVRVLGQPVNHRSEERRVGKECRARRSA